MALIYFGRSSGEAATDKLSDLFTAIGLTAVAVVVLDLAVTIYRELVTTEGEKRHRILESLGSSSVKPRKSETLFIVTLLYSSYSCGIRQLSFEFLLSLIPLRLGGIPNSHIFLHDLCFDRK